MSDAARLLKGDSPMDGNGDQPLPNVGGRLRAVREQRGLSLRALAERSGLSVTAISQIERGANSPTVASLHMLATTLEVPITEFFRHDEIRSTIFVKRSQRMRAEREHLDIESLGVGLRHQQLEPFMVTLHRGAKSSELQPITHGGQEFVYCVEGQVAYEVGADVYTLGAGDTLLFEATQPHRFWNTGRGAAQLLLVFASSEDVQAGRRQHLGT